MNQSHRAQAALMYIIKVIDHVEHNAIDNNAAFTLLRQRVSILNDEVTKDEDVLDYIIKNKSSLRQHITLKNMIHYLKNGYRMTHKEVMSYLDITRPTVLKYLKEQPDDIHQQLYIENQKLEWLFFELHRLMKDPKPYQFFIL